MFHFDNVKRRKSSQTLSNKSLPGFQSLRNQKINNEPNDVSNNISHNKPYEVKTNDIKLKSNQTHLDEKRVSLVETKSLKSAVTNWSQTKTHQVCFYILVRVIQIAYVQCLRS
jgi:hypothetical protein